MLLSTENWLTISSCLSSPSCHHHSHWLGEPLSTPYLTHMTLYLLSGAACNSGLYFWGAQHQWGILKSPCCLQSQSQAAIFKMSPAINCKRGWIMLITITRCTGKSNLWRQPAMHREEIPAPSPALGCPRTASLSFQRHCSTVCN